MFKLDGTPIRDPAAYVKKLGAGVYKGDLVDADGQVIHDPAIFVQEQDLSHTPRGIDWSRVDTSSGAVMFKANGTPVRDPTAFVNAMSKTGGYQGGLFTSDGKEIEDPIRYVQTHVDPSQVKTEVGKKEVEWSEVDASQAVMFKADGTPVRDPAAFVNAMSRTGGYQGGLFTGNGEEIRDPVSFMKTDVDPGFTPRESGNMALEDGARRDKNTLYKEDGTPVRDVVAYVSAMARKGSGYKGGLFNHKGEEIRDAEAYVRKMAPVQAAALYAPQPFRGGGAVGGGGHYAPARGGGFDTPTRGGGGGSGPTLYKADGTPVRDPIAFVAGMEKTGGYKGGLFNEKGQAIRDPAGYIKGFVARSGGGAITQFAPPTPRSFSPGLRTPVGGAVGVFGGGGGGGKGSTITKADGTVVRDPLAYLEAMERKGGAYKGDLYNSKGQQIRDPKAYLANMSTTKKAPTARAPRTAPY